MPFGAHESMEAHEMLEAKICMIDHFSFYISQCQDETLRSMIYNQLQRAIQSYNQLVTYTHSYQVAKPVVNQQTSNILPNQIEYGLRSPQPVSPQMNMKYFNDHQIAGSVLSSHKNSSKNHMAAALECADPNVRQMMMNSAVECCNMAYEIFLYMNKKGYYQVPTLDSHTAKTMLHHYQPMGTMQMSTGTQGNMGMNMQTGMQTNAAQTLNSNYQ